MDADNASIPETSKNSGIDVSRPDLTPAATTEPAISVVQSDAGSRTNERTQEETSEATRKKTTKPTDFEIGYLAGLVDGEGYIFVSFVKDGDRTRPNLRIYCTSKQIIDGACRIMQVNPFPRRDKGELVGWLASASGAKALESLRRIEPYLVDSSKRCRAETILKTFDGRVSIRGRHPSSEVFSHCPPPVRSRVKAKSPRDDEVTQGEIKTGQNRMTVRDIPREQVYKRAEIPIENSITTRGWLCGIVDGEGYIHIRYRSDRNSMYPRLRIFVKSKHLIDEVARSMGVNPYARRKHGRHLGWYASVSHLKALRVLRLIAPHLSEPSKRCRANKILEAFGDVGTIHSRLVSSEFFSDCPAPSRIRKSGRIIKNDSSAYFSEVGKPGHPGGLISLN